jgi:hypothetical protein
MRSGRFGMECVVALSTIFLAVLLLVCCCPPVRGSFVLLFACPAFFCVLLLACLSFFRVAVHLSGFL